MAKTTVEEVWEYEYDLQFSEPDIEFEDDEPTTRWIEEDDEWSASWKAISDRGATGNIRSYTRTVTVSKPVVKVALTKAELTSHLR